MLLYSYTKSGKLLLVCRALAACSDMRVATHDVHGSDLDEATRKLWSHPRLLSLVESIIGPEIGGNPVWNLRSKTPNTALTTVPWHQDIAYLCPGAEATPQPTAWIPLLDVNEQNGTLKLIRGGHRRNGSGSDPTILRHFLENDRRGERALIVPKF